MQTDSCKAELNDTSVRSTWDINTDEVFVAGICIFLVWISKAVVWRIEEEAISLRQYFTIVLAIFLVAVAVSTHYMSFVAILSRLMSLFQDHVACWNFTLTGPH